jgi:hypothetical protein
VSQCGAIVRDNMPIKYREWKGKPSNPYVVPDSIKDQLWNDVLNTLHFLKASTQTLLKVGLVNSVLEFQEEVD